MLWLKAFHIVAVVTWFASLFYLPRLLVYHAEATEPVVRDRLKIMERRLLGMMRIGSGLTVIFGFATLFAFAHAYQGPTGILITGILGLVFAVLFVASGRNLWINVIAHGVYDTGSFLLVLTSYDRVLAAIGHRVFG